MVIDLAVVNDRTGPVAVEHRLSPVGDIDNTQTPVPEADIAVDEHTAIVRPPVMQNVAYLHDRCLRDLFS